MAGLNRRDFLRALGLTSGTSVVAACGFDQNYYPTPIETVLPYVVRPEQIIPGNPVFFATTVTTGPAAFPVLARHREGRVVNAGSNPQAPLPPAIPKAALLELQRAYSPDRLKVPSAGGADTTWDDALSKVADAVKSARAAGKKVAWLGGYRSGAIVELVNAFTNNEAVFFEPLGRDAEVEAAERVFGKRFLPAYDLSKARHVLSFGADFLTNWGSVTLASQYASARNPNAGGFVARFGFVGPHRGQTGANADDWYAATPGSEALVALAVAKIVASSLGYSGPLSGTLAAFDVASAIAASGLTQAQLDEMAKLFAAGPAVALPGGTVGATKAATDLATATYILNLVGGNGGVTFGVGPSYSGPIHSYARVEQLIADMAAGTVGVLLVDDPSNPVYALPAASGFAEALAKVDTFVSLSSFTSETSANAKIILPVASLYEDWGDEEPQDGLFLLRQPAMSPLYDGRSVGDVLLATARAAGLPDPAAIANVAADAGVPVAVAPIAPVAPVAAAPTAIGFTPATWLDFVKARWQRDVFPKSGEADFRKFWDRSLSLGAADFRPALAAPEVTATPSASAAATFDGPGEYYLIAYSHAFRMDGRYANEPWAQEASDPMTGQVWDTWLEINPATADKLGLKDNDLVEVTTAQGAMQLGVERTPHVREDAVAIAFGNGRTASGRYAGDVGQNVVKLLAAAKDGAGCLAWQSSKASLKAVGARASLVSTFGGDTDEQRGFGVVVDAGQLAQYGDTPSDKPGKLTHLEYPKLDKRLTDAGINDWYGLTEHPTYRFGMTVDVNACNGCGACAIACYAENNLPIVGKTNVGEGREMAWIRVARYEADYAAPNRPEATLTKDVRFVPMMCQQCGHAPCESVCPVLATYHTIDGLNAMIYNRCVGTRYCANNCPYGARRFNWHTYVWPEPFNLLLNPDASARTMGVMEKCTFCVQRIRSTKSAYRTHSIENGNGFIAPVPDDALRRLTACADACPTEAITFGNLNDAASKPAATRKSARHYELLADLNVFPAVNYLGKASFHPPEHAAHGAEGAEHAEGGHEPAPSEHH